MGAVDYTTAWPHWTSEMVRGGKCCGVSRNEGNGTGHFGVIERL